MDGIPVFSPRTVSITQCTAYPASTVCAPVSSGPNIYFPSHSQYSTTVYEMFVQDDAVTNDAANVTAHVPIYVATKTVEMAANNDTDTLFCRPPNTNQLYVYQTYWAGDEKVQSAWGRWMTDVNLAIQSIFTVEEYAYCVFTFRGATNEADFIAGDEKTLVFVGRMNLKVGMGSPEVSLTNPIHLDALVKVTGEYNSSENKTYFTAPFPFMHPYLRNNTRMVVAGGANTGKGYYISEPGPLVVGEGDDYFTFSLAGDQSTNDVLLGLLYSQVLQLSEQFWMDGERPALNARLQLRNMTVSFVDTAYFKTEVIVLGTPTQVNEVVTRLLSTYTARTVGNEDFLLNRPQVKSGSHRFPVLGRSNDVQILLINDDFMPSHFVNAEWEGLVTTRTRR
jgi:hypothetical protein